MNSSLSAFLNRLIDYAGLFPPANLPLQSAIEKYSAYQNGEDSWMMGPFVLPVSQLNQIESHLHLFSKERLLPLSITSGRSCSEEECIEQYKEGLQSISNFADACSNQVKVELLEVPLPPIVPSLKLLQEIANGAETLGVHAFCEVLLVDDWKKHVAATLDVMELHNSSTETWLGVKLRTGGVQADMFPSPEQVAFVIAACRDRRLPMKFTAGLHHPIRMYREELHTRMHGFLNIFMAGLLSHSQNLEIKQIEEILLDEDTKSFSIEEECLIWKHFSIHSKEISRLREKALLSFGSCSFDEPRIELMNLKNQQEALL